MRLKNLAFQISALALAGCLGSNVGYAAESADMTLVHQPAVSRDHLAFVYAGDIWLTDRNGQHPVQLTTHPAAEFSPAFSPDGKWIAFSASYDNNTDVYVMPVSGGQARRLTWHPGQDIVRGWSADGKRILFSSSREIANSRSNQLYEVPLTGGFEKKVMEAVAYQGTWSPDGKLLAYQPYRPAYAATAGWRQHRGGSTPPIWIIDPVANTLEKIPHTNATDSNPLWVGNDVIFISDRNDGAANLFVYQRQSKTVRQLTHETVWDVRNAAVSGNTVVFEVAGQLKELDLSNGTIRPITVALNAQALQARTQWKDASKTIASAQLSPTGKRVLLSARGDIFSVPVKDGSTHNLTETSGVREKDGLWSADGKQIAYISDAGLHHTLILRDQLGLEKPRSLALGSAYYKLLDWSPDGKVIVFQDYHLNLFAITLENGNIKKIDSTLRRASFNIAFSPDSRWLAYTVSGENHFSRIKLHDFQSGKNTLISDTLTHADNPVFAEKDYLYFTASTNSGPSQVGLDMSTQERPLRNGIYVAVLAADGKSPLLPKTGDENEKDDSKADDKKTDDKSVKTDGEKSAGHDKSGKDAKLIKIDLEGLPNRIVALPLPERNYDSLAVAADGALFYLEHKQPGISTEGPDANPHDDAELYRFNFEDKKAKSLRSGVGSFSLSADRKKLLLESGGNQFQIADANDKLDAKPINLSNVKMLVNPHEEWEQIFNETWWMEKEFFYDPNLHGLDWDAIYARYHPLLKGIQRREDLNDLLTEMIGELQVGHNRIGGGDIYRETPASVGLLGADLEVDHAHYRIKAIYYGDRWNPFLKAPLAAPGLGIKEGNYILAINGKPLQADINIYQYLENTVGKQVLLTVAEDANGTNKHNAVIEPIANESALRQWRWIEHNRAYVQEKSAGKIAYVYMPDTGADGYQEFNRMFFAQSEKPALILDDRRNSGGQVANYVTDILSRPYLAGWKDRDGAVSNTPGSAIYGPKAMLIDQDAGSGGDFMPYAFQRLKLGPLVGKRTWGGLIGISANPDLIDGGSLVVPFFRVFSPEGEWVVENKGVSPDIEVELDPLAVNQGRDPQLDAAIANVLQRLQSYQPIPRNASPAMPTKLGQ